MIYNSKNDFWTDEKGISIPASRITKAEKLKEKNAAKIVKEAALINKALKAFKDLITELIGEAYEMDLKEKKVAENGKGNYVLYSFDRSIKVEVNINERIEFDENLIGAAKEKFEAFLTEGTNGVDEMIRELIRSAFETVRKGKLDTKKVLSLLAYRSRISEAKYPQFHEALKLIEDSIRRPDSRTYYRVWEKDQEGKYQALELNFSAI